MPESSKCQICDAPATVHLTQIVQNQVHKLDLCESCAKEKGVTDPDGFSLTDLVTQALGKEADETPARLVCEQCGCTDNDFRKRGRMGCPACYDALGELIESQLADLHTGSRHLGKIPVRAGKLIAVSGDLRDMEKSLAMAITEENYEEAARLRDAITDLKTNAEADANDG